MESRSRVRGSEKGIEDDSIVERKRTRQSIGLAHYSIKGFALAAVLSRYPRRGFEPRTNAGISCGSQREKMI